MDPAALDVQLIGDGSALRWGSPTRSASVGRAVGFG